MRQSGLGLLLFGDIFDYWFHCIAGYWPVTIFYFLPALVLGGYVLLGMHPFLLSCWHVGIHNILWYLLVFLWWCLLFLLSHEWFCLFGSSFFILFFFPQWAWLEVYQFCWSFQRTSFWFHWSFLVSVAFISGLIFIISFLLLILGFVLFLAPLGVRLGCLFVIFLTWGRLVLLETSLLELL